MGDFQNVDPDIDHGAASLEVLAPKNAPVGDPSPAKSLAARVEDVAELTGLRGFPQEICLAAEAVLEPDDQLPVILRRGIDHGLRFFGIHGHRFLYQDVRACVQSGDGVGSMQEVRGTDADRIGLDFGQHLLAVREALGDVVGVGVLRHRFFVDVGQSDDLYVVHLCQVSHMGAGDSPGADEGHAELLGLRLLGCSFLGHD